MKIYKPLYFKENIPIKPGHTISKSIYDKEHIKINLFSMADSTDISQEYYDHGSVFICLEGNLLIQDKSLNIWDLYLASKGSSRGVYAKEDSIYMEISLLEGGDLMENLEKGKIINLKDAIEYVDGGVSNLDIVSRDDIKIMLMAFDQGQGLTPHAAPEDALVIALEGEAEILVDDETYVIKEGQSIAFPKDVTHNVTAKNSRYKMALILVI